MDCTYCGSSLEESIMVIEASLGRTVRRAFVTYLDLNPLGATKNHYSNNQ